MTLYREKYRVESARLKDWDYASPGFYFVTICTRFRENFFGTVSDGRVQRSPVGDIVADEWMQTEKIRPNVKMDSWIVMPNHVHGIVQITHRISPVGAPTAETLQRNVSTPAVSASNGSMVDIPASNPSRLKPNTLGSIIGQIKIRCTKRIRALGNNEFNWQERFWDEILWDEPALNNVRWYIETNPVSWERDKENPSGIRM